MLRLALAARPSILALLAGAIVLIACSLARAAGQSFHFRSPNWSSLIDYEAIGVLAFVSVPSCIVGAFGGRFIGWRR